MGRSMEIEFELEDLAREAGHPLPRKMRYGTNGKTRPNREFEIVMRIVREVAWDRGVKWGSDMG